MTKILGKKKHFKADRAFNGFNYAILSILAIFTLLPFYNVIITSLALQTDIIQSPILLVPKRITFDSYIYIFNDNLMIRSFLNSIFITITGTLYSIFLIFTFAYVLSKNKVKGVKLLFIYIVITMYFSGGLIPDYILIKNLNMMNKFSSLILPQGINTFYLFVVLGYLRGNPASLEDAAKIVIMTICLFLIVDRWNDWFPAMLYLKDSEKFPVSYLLRTIIVGANQSVLQIGQNEIDRWKNVYPEGIQKASIVFVMAPIMILYPFVQKYFTKGITLGAIKG